jgi:hypothetical protein
MPDRNICLIAHPGIVTVKKYYLLPLRKTKLFSIGNLYFGLFWFLYLADSRPATSRQQYEENGNDNGS